MEHLSTLSKATVRETRASNKHERARLTPWNASMDSRRSTRGGGSCDAFERHASARSRRRGTGARRVSEESARMESSLIPKMEKRTARAKESDCGWKRTRRREHDPSCSSSSVARAFHDVSTEEDTSPRASVPPKTKLDSFLRDPLLAFR